MLVLIDESGDSGLRQLRGTSDFFVVSLVVFEDSIEAERCDREIQILKEKLKWRDSEEFHFKRNSNRVRKMFLETVSKHNFFYYAVIISKWDLLNTQQMDKESFYRYACGLVFENAKEKLESATVIIDESGGVTFKRQLAKHLRSKMNQNSRRIKKVKMQNSRANNLLQIADYIAGLINRSAKSKKDTKQFMDIIRHREIDVHIWP